MAEQTNIQKKRSLKAGAAASYLYILAHIVSNFLYVPVLISGIGQQEYGLYQMVTSMFSCAAILENSLSVGIQKAYCKAKPSGGQALSRTLAVCKRGCLYLEGISAVFCAVCILFLQMFYRTSFSEAELQEGTMILLLLFVGLGITVASECSNAALQAEEEFIFLKLLSSAQELLLPTICLLILRSGAYAVTAAAVQVSLSSAAAFIRALYYHRRFPVRARIDFRDKQAEKTLLLFSGSILTAQIADQIFWKADQLILGKYYGASVVAIYAIGSQIYTNYMYAGTPVASVFFPRLVRISEQPDAIRQMSDLFIRVGRLAFFALLLVLTTFILIGQDFIRLWAGAAFQSAYAVALIVMVPFTIDVIQNLGLSILQVLGKYTFRAQMYLTAALLNVISTAIMAKYGGMDGAAASTAVTMLLTSGFIMNWYYGKQIGLNITDFWKNILGIMLRMLPVFLVSGIIRSQLGNLHGVSFLIFAICYATLYGVWAYGFVTNHYEKQLIRQITRKLFDRNR